MYVITEYQYQQLRNVCKDAFVDEIGRQPLKTEIAVLKTKVEKFVVLEHLFLPSRGLRFFSMSDGVKDGKLRDGRTAYKIVKITTDLEEAKKLSREINVEAMYEGEREWSKLCHREQEITFPLTVNERQINSAIELDDFLRSICATF